MGDDPNTVDVDITQTETTSLQVHEVQNVTALAVTRLINGGEVTFTYTDMYGGSWTTRPVQLPHVTTFANAFSKMSASPFMWTPVALELATFDVRLASTHGAAAVSNIAIGSTHATITVTAGTAAGLAIGDVMVIDQHFTATDKGFSNNMAVKVSAILSKSTLKLTMADDTAHETTASGIDSNCRLTRAISIRSLDVHQSTDAHRTIRLDRPLTTSQAAAIRAGDQILVSTGSGSYSCALTLRDDAASGRSLTVTAAPLGYRGTTPATWPAYCRVPMLGRVVSITIAGLVTFGGGHTLGAGDLVMFTGLEGGAGLQEGEVYRVSSVGSAYHVTLGSSEDTTAGYLTDGTRYPASGWTISAAYTGANMTIVGRKVDAIDTDGDAVFTGSIRARLASHLYLHSLTGGTNADTNNISPIRPSAGDSTLLPHPLVIEFAGTATSAKVVLNSNPAAGGTSMALHGSQVTEGYAVAGSAVHYVSAHSPPRAHIRFGQHHFEAGDKVVFSQLRAYSLRKQAADSVTLTADCSVAAASTCTVTTGAAHGLSTGDRILCVGEGTVHHTSTSKFTLNTFYIVVVATPTTFTARQVASASVGPNAAQTVDGAIQDSVTFRVPGHGLAQGTTYTVGTVVHGDSDYMQSAVTTAEVVIDGTTNTYVAGTGTFTSSSAPHGFAVGDTVRVRAITGSNSGLALDDMFVIRTATTNVFTVASLDGTAVTCLAGADNQDTDIKFVPVPYFTLTREDGGALAVTEAYQAAGSGAFVHRVGHDQPAEPLYLHTAMRLKYDAAVTDIARFDGDAYDVTSFDSTSGAIVTEPLGGVYDLRKGIFPGDWVRVYVPTVAPGGWYCDCQVDVQPSTATGLSCGTGTMTTTHRARARGGACDTISGINTLAMGHLSISRVIDSGVAPVYPADQTDTVQIDEDASVGPGRLRVTWSGAGGFTAAHLVVLRAGAVLLITSANFVVQCAGVVVVPPVAAGANQLYISSTAPGGIHGAACVTQSALVGALVAQGSNAIYFTGEDPGNEGHFAGLAVGDAVRVSGMVVDAVGDGTTLEIERTDPNHGANTALFFPLGIAPHGQGMYPILPGHTGLVGGRLAVQRFPGDSIAPTAIVQVARTNARSDGDSDGAAGVAVSSTGYVVAAALEALPFGAMNNVSVAFTSTGLELYAMTVTFGGSRNTGDQQPLVMGVDGCDLDGCQPRYRGVFTQTGYFSDADGKVVAADQVGGYGQITSDGDGRGLFPAAPDLLSTGSEEVVVYSSDQFAGWEAARRSDAFTDRGAVYTAHGRTESALFVAAKAIAVRADDPPLGVGVVALERSVGNGDLRGPARYFRSVTFEITRGTTERAECARRGKCDRVEARCECTEGYAGEACTVKIPII